MPEIKKIAIIEPVGSHGGMNYYDYGLAYGLSENNIEVLYFSCNETESRNFANVTLIRSFRNVWQKKALKKLYYFFAGYKNAFNLSKKKGISIIHLHFFDLGILNFLVLLFSKYYSFKTIATIHDISTFNGKTNTFIEKLSYQLIDGIIVHNQSSKNEILKKVKVNSLLEIIPHGNYLPFIEKLPLPNNKKELKLLFFGQLKEVKGLEILLNAMAIVIKNKPFIKLVIAGRPWKTDKDYYEKLIEKLNIQNNVETHFRFIKDEEIKKFFLNASIVVLPYKRIYQSGVLLLSMSYGRATIVSDLQAFTDVVQNKKTAFIFKNQNPMDLANCILNITFEELTSVTNSANQLIEDQYNWIKIGSLTKQFYSNFS